MDGLSLLSELAAGESHAGAGFVESSDNLPHPRQSYSTFDLDLVTLRRIQSNVVNEYERPAKKATAGTAPHCFQAARHFCTVSAARAQGLGKAPRRSRRRLRADRFHLTSDGHRRHRDQVRESGARL